MLSVTPYHYTLELHRECVYIFGFCYRNTSFFVIERAFLVYEVIERVTHTADLRLSLREGVSYFITGRIISLRQFELSSALARGFSHDSGNHEYWFLAPSTALARAVTPPNP